MFTYNSIYLAIYKLVYYAYKKIFHPSQLDDLKKNDPPVCYTVSKCS